MCAGFRARELSACHYDGYNGRKYAFLPTISPEDLTYKAVATNLSDLAAMGAQPKWVSLALTLPNVDENWISTFSQSLLHRLKQYNVTLIGGDTTKGNLSITITAQGFIEKVKEFVGIKRKLVI